MPRTEITEENTLGPKEPLNWDGGEASQWSYVDR